MLRRLSVLLTWSLLTLSPAIAAIAQNAASIDPLLDPITLGDWPIATFCFL